MNEGRKEENFKRNRGERRGIREEKKEEEKDPFLNFHGKEKNHFQLPNTAPLSYLTAATAASSLPSTDSSALLTKTTPILSGVLWTKKDSACLIKALVVASRATGFKKKTT